MEIPSLIDDYATGPQKLRDAIAGMTPNEIDAVPVPGKWSTRQVVCHLADFEPVYADRMKHVIAEDQPTFAGGYRKLVRQAQVRRPEWRRM
ncbi:MAG: DinB family protein [Planctomycetes bacterium]|nr:DinB family protein [Planctomycetota bacterium]